MLKEPCLEAALASGSGREAEMLIPLFKGWKLYLLAGESLGWLQASAGCMASGVQSGVTDSGLFVISAVGNENYSPASADTRSPWVKIISS